MTEDNVMQARSMFKKMPDDVFINYLAPLISDLGWPFESDEQSVIGTSWERVLNGVSLKDLSSANWGVCEVNFSRFPICPQSENDIRLVIENSNSSADNYLGYDLKRCRESFFFNRHYLIQNGEFISPVVLLISKELFVKVLDGNHRLAALFSVGAKKYKSLKAWVGSIA
ncbi:hypothetical protein [Ketobacter sp. GenoA1]|uniref:hypothetical protein n=1 Tax=Ketobacter sp. GenoA1 TaxID=2072747 RepID=UPI000F1125D2|nr:hypothetical protein [Ketobacter sp. GenoA1]RLT90784.1 MAG: hypothetical protein D9N13_06065 [Ketobacter sp. GenoA1]